MIYNSSSYEETRNIAFDLAQKLPIGTVIAMSGDLGAGKTAFSGGFIEGLGYQGRVTSPTFAIVNEYETPKGGVCHFDMYRILDEESLYDLGFDDYLDSGKTLIIEWSENIKGALPLEIVTVDIRNGQNQDDRIITIMGADI